MSSRLDTSAAPRTNALTRTVTAFVMALLLTRASLDPILTLTQGGSVQSGYNAGSAGVGAVLNVFVLLFGVLCWIGSQNRRERLELLWVPFALVIALGIVRSPFVYGAVRTSSNLLTYIAMFTLGLVLTRNERHLERNLRYVILSSLIPLAYAIFDFAFGRTFIEGERRIQSTFAHPNIFGFYLNTLMSCLFAYRLCIRDRKIKIVYCDIILLVALTELVLSQSRSAWIAAALQIGSVTLVVSWPMFIATALLACFSVFIPAVQSRLMSLESGNSYRGGWQTKLNSYAWRKLLWERGLRDLGDDWVAGRGLESFRTRSPDFFPLDRTMVYPHNVFVQLLYDTGIFGVVSYVFVFAALAVIAIAKAGSQPRGAVIFVGLLASHLIVSYSDNVLDYLSYDWYFWFMVGTLLAALRLELLKRPRGPGATEVERVRADAVRAAGHEPATV